jgi:hypothetical protein
VGLLYSLDIRGLRRLIASFALAIGLAWTPRTLNPAKSPVFRLEMHEVIVF